MRDSPEVIVVGGGLAGLCCALRLHEAAVPVQLLEAGSRVGGRIQTDLIEGFRLDRGFQVLLTAYPEARRMLDYATLDLHPLEPGAWIYFRGGLHRLDDPWRHPLTALGALLSPVAPLSDKLRVSRLRSRVMAGPVEALLERPETSTLDALRSDGFSDVMIERFFRPFLGGVFLEGDLRTSSRMFEFIFRMFATGEATLPAAGMGAIPAQLAGRLPADSLQTRARVTAVQRGSVQLAQGDQVSARAVVVATDATAAAHLLGTGPAPSFRSTTCLYFAAEDPPIDEPKIILDGEEGGPVNHVSVPSVVAPSYAPPGAALISANLLGEPGDSDDTLEDEVRSQLRRWFGREVNGWRHLRTYRIHQALPELGPHGLSDGSRSPRLRPGLYLCGDYCETPSIQGAMLSGRRAAEAVLEDLAAG